MRDTLENIQTCNNPNRRLFSEVLKKHDLWNENWGL